MIDLYWGLGTTGYCSDLSLSQLLMQPSRRAETMGGRAAVSASFSSLAARGCTVPVPALAFG
jgi:hypothetical protein